LVLIFCQLRIYAHACYGGGIALGLLGPLYLPTPMIYNQSLDLLLGSEIKEIYLLGTTCFTFILGAGIPG
jgi:hypothetical protein